MGERYTKQIKTRCNVHNNDKCFHQNLMIFFFDVWMYEREVRSPTQYSIAVVGT